MTGIADWAPATPSGSAIRVDNPHSRPNIRGVTMYDLDETFTHTLDSVLESIDVYGEDELLDDDDLSLLHDADDDCDDGDEI